MRAESNVGAMSLIHLEGVLNMRTVHRRFVIVINGQGHTERENKREQWAVHMAIIFFLFQVMEEVASGCE